MKKLNIYPIDWNADEHWIIEARDEFDWVEGMFHKKIINEIDLDLKINHLNKFEQLEKLSNNPRAIIGGHTHSHNVMSELNKKTLNKEIKLSIDMIQKNLKFKIKHYSYPEGQKSHYNSDVINCLKKFESS